MKIVEYVKETRGEMKHVSWPTRKQSVNFTLLVIGISIVTALLLGFFDFGFSLGLEKIVESRPYRDSGAFPPVSTSTDDVIPTTPIDFNLDL